MAETKGCLPLSLISKGRDWRSNAIESHARLGYDTWIVNEAASFCFGKGDVSYRRARLGMQPCTPR